MTYAVVLPYTYEPYFEACRATMRFDPDRVLICDNRPPHNIGIMRAHNRGVDFMRQLGADWLIIVSAAVRFGEPGGLDFADVLDEHMDHYVIHGSNPRDRGIFGWHLTAFRSTLFDRIGVWDENFSPYGLDDIDLSLRIKKEYHGAPGWNGYVVDVTDTTMSHSLNLAGVKSAYPPRNAYFTRKWGRDGAEWQSDGYARPFNLEVGLDWWPEPDHPLSIWQNEFAGEWTYDD
jgi:hypothetical protein